MNYKKKKHNNNNNIKTVENMVHGLQKRKLEWANTYMKKILSS